MTPSKSTNPLAQLSASLADAVDTAGRSIVAIHARRRIPSSGVIWRDGIIVAASHTTRRDGEVAVSLPSGEPARATVIGRDGATDLVVLKLNGASAPVAQRASEDSARIGSLVLAVGRPGRSVSASFGIVSAVADEWRSAQGGRIGRVLRLDLSIYDGFSGGPLVDASGAVIGVDNSALARGVPVALPAPTVDRVVDALLAHGHMRRPFIGVAVQHVSLNAATVARNKLSHDSGLVIVSLADGSPADSAGILIGDVLLAVGGQPLRHPTDLLDALSNVGEGAAIEVELLRGGSVVKSSVTPIDRAARGDDDEEDDR
ncbi:MAG TPA: S1C family serine protease [Gemmatimonadaceae bacterium]|nr:S1C family serine protease [Gemmatimonadaceae bacterium]